MLTGKPKLHRTDAFLEGTHIHNHDTDTYEPHVYKYGRGKMTEAISWQISGCTLKFPNTGSHSTVWTHGNTAHTGRNG